MERNLIVLPDGTELYSGAGQVNALRSVTLTECVNSGTELTVGSVCACLLEASVFAPGGGLSLEAGAEIALYRVEDGGSRTQIGLFTLEKPTRSSPNLYSLTAYDRIARLDRDLTAWVSGLNAWPYTLYDFAGLVCAQCGLELANGSLPNGDFLIQRFSGEGITGRQLMTWIGEAAACFCRAMPDGKLEFAWYQEADVSIGPSARSGLFYYQDGFSYEDYRVEPIEKVQIRFSDKDVGVIWPGDTGEANTYTVTGNYLLATDTTDRLLPVAQAIYDALKDASYTPGKVSVPAGSGLRAGQIVTVTDGSTARRMYIMRRKREGQKDTLECTGSRRRDSVTLVNNRSYKALSGKVLDLQVGVEGLRVENADTSGKVTSLGLTVDGLSSLVSQQTNRQDTLENRMTQVQQDAYSLSVTVRGIQDSGVDQVTTREKKYTLNDNGLIISQPGKEIENRIDETGMYVSRSGIAMLQANKDGVIAHELTARNYLKIGHARLEAYGAGATACFWMRFASGQNILLGSDQTFTNNEYRTASYVTSSPLVAGETYTVSVDITPGAGVKELRPYVSGGYWSLCSLAVSGTGRQTLRKTFRAAYYPGMEPAVNPIYAQVWMYRFPNDGTVTGSTTIHRCKIEIGDTPTEWSPAPEDS